jgi:soluble lytic murein transglycosylase
MRGRLLRLTWSALAWDLGIAVAMIAIGLGALYWRVHRFDGAIRAAGTAYGVDPELLRAMIWRESRFDPGAVGKAGEIGLMQVTPGAAAEWAAAENRSRPSRQDLLDPKTNTRAGAWYVGRAIRRWSGRPDPVPFALAEYNAGLSNADRWARDATNALEFRSKIGYPTTRKYVDDILARYRGGASGKPGRNSGKTEAR